MWRWWTGWRLVGRGAARALALALALVAWIAVGCAERRQARVAPPLPPPPAGPVLEAPIAERVAVYGPLARGRMHPFFAAAGVPYPPAQFLLLGLKRERELQLYAAGRGQRLRYIRSYPVLGASGRLGPKLREGDRQVPEGIYGITYLNPHSIAHLSLALSYPNDFDRARAAEDGRDQTALGGEIMIHGGSGSVGCLAVGDPAAEDLFVLAADSGWESAAVVISPVDFRRAVLPVDYRPPAPWVAQLYGTLRARLYSLPPPAWSAATSVTAGTR